MRPTTSRRAAGFSLVELLMATSLLLVVVAGVFGALQPSEGAFRVEPERADVEQRLRAAIDALTRDLVGAGAGPSQGLRPGPLTDALPPVLPFRQGRRSPDAPGQFRTDTVTLVRVVGSAAQTAAAAPFGAQSTTVSVAIGPGCPPGDAACGFRRGTTLVAFDGTGAFDLFTVTAVTGAALTLQHNMRDALKVYPAGRTMLAEAASRTYYLQADEASDTYQLRQYDGGAGNDVPVVDHVVNARFEYYGDPRPPMLLQPLTDEPGPRTTYGPSPSATEANCLFSIDGTGRPPPLLQALGSGEALVPLTSSSLTDGPWCPDALSPNRYDADLFRVRSILVRLRVEAAARSLRGPAGLLFSRGGTARRASAMAPDREVVLEVAPPNLVPRR